MTVILLRTLLIYFLIILAMRLMGKKQLGELQPSELVSTILISNLASIPIESPEIPLLSSIVPVFIVVSLEILLSALSPVLPRHPPQRPLSRGFEGYCGREPESLRAEKGNKKEEQHWSFALTVLLLYIQLFA